MNKWTIKKAEENENLELKIKNMLFDIIKNNIKNESLYDIKEIIENATKEFIKEYAKNLNTSFYYISAPQIQNYAYSFDINTFAKSINEVGRYKTEKEAYVAIENNFKQNKIGDGFETWEEYMQDSIKRGLYKLNYCSSEQDFSKIKLLK